MAIVGVTTGSAMAASANIRLKKERENKPEIDKRPLLTSLWGIVASKDGKANARRLNKMIDHALDTGRSWIDVDSNAIIDDVAVPVRKKTEVFFRYAGGELIGLYRRETIQSGTPSNVRIENGLNEEGMTQFYLADSAKVVVMGDSLSIYGPNALSNTDCMFSIISKKIKSQNTKRNVDIVNMAMGGQTWMHANTKPTAFPSWYINHEKEWLDCVREEEPDLLILAFGMNDSNGFNAGAFHAVVNKVKSWSKVPSIIFVTNPVPAMATSWENGAGFYGKIFQEGRDWVAGYIRSYAKFYGYSVLDINRQLCLIRDGRDYINAPLTRVGVYEQSYIDDEDILVRDFSFSAMVSQWQEGRALKIKTGCGENDYILITEYNGCYKLSAFCDGMPTVPYVEIVTDTQIQIGQEINLGVQNNRLSLFINEINVTSFHMIRTGGEFNPLLTWNDESKNGPFSTITLNSGNWLQCQYTARDSDIWGLDDGGAETKIPTGGNGINHYSSNGLSLIVAPVVEAFDFSRKTVDLTSIIETVSTGIQAMSEIKVNRTGEVVTLSGHISSLRDGALKICVLPAGYRPLRQKIITTASLGKAGWEMAVIDISPDGTISLASGSIGELLSLDGVTFKI